MIVLLSSARPMVPAFDAAQAWQGTLVRRAPFRELEGAREGLNSTILIAQYRVARHSIGP